MNRLNFLQHRNNAKQHLGELADTTLTMLFVLVACIALVMAFVVKNRVVRVATLAWFLLP